MTQTYHPNQSMLSFPRGFFWGAATAAHQIEGNNTNSDWWQAEQTGLLPHRSETACDSWTQLARDIDLLKDIGLNAYRLSVEWARIEPYPGRFDQVALDNYRAQIEALKHAGIEPMVTLHHFTNPRWLADQGGWTNPDVVPRFVDYSARGRQPPAGPGALVDHHQRAQHPRHEGIPRRHLATPAAE